MKKPEPIYVKWGELLNPILKNTLYINIHYFIIDTFCEYTLNESTQKP